MKKRFDDDFDSCYFCSYPVDKCRCTLESEDLIEDRGEFKKLKGDDVPTDELTDKQRRQSWD
jgi:hypothetical protein